MSKQMLLTEWGYLPQMHNILYTNSRKQSIFPFAKVIHPTNAASENWRGPVFIQLVTQLNLTKRNDNLPVANQSNTLRNSDSDDNNNNDNNNSISCVEDPLD